MAVQLDIFIRSFEAMVNFLMNFVPWSVLYDACIGSERAKKLKCLFILIFLIVSTTSSRRRHFPLLMVSCGYVSCA